MPLAAEKAASPDEQEPEVLLTFREHMWDSFGKLWSEKVEPSRKFWEDFTATLKDRIQVERAYAASLDKLTDRLQPHLDKDIVPAPIEAMVANIRNRAEHSAWIADELEQDAVPPIEKMLSNHVGQGKRVHVDGKELMAQWQEAYRTYEQLATKYMQACSDAEASAKECLNAVAMQPAERTKLASRCLVLSRGALQAEKAYYKGVHRLNDAVEEQQRKMGHVLHTMQMMEEMRGRCCQDTIGKLVVYETSWVRNVQYDLNSVIATNNDYDPQAELQKYIRENQTSKPYPVRSSPKGFWELGAPSRHAGTRRPSTATSQQGEALFAERLNLVRPLMSKLITPATDGSGGTPSPPGESRPPDHELMELNRGLVGEEKAAEKPERHERRGSKTMAPQPSVPSVISSNGAAHRAALCSALREALMGPAGASSFGLQSRGLGTGTVVVQRAPVRLASTAFSAAVSLFMKALDGCSQEHDVWNGRDLMTLAPKVLQEVGGKEENILMKVHPHKVWSKEAFWEDMLIISIAEAHALIAVGRRNDRPGCEHREVPMTDFLHTYVRYMEQLGIELPKASASVAKTLKKHAHLLGNTTSTYLELLTQAAPTAVTARSHSY
eukprot:CAMPEP_0178376254 /NCGR_PEP_ID=MMETSP0689_2-20121128/3307_1 /TAXON_ID=160604 /ORGANISM="Amphidinium massartii, Strain CS-259" /LENGTH=609 /DNA_ID=CAMNT_0019996269 /DNA_START=1 /DNA_END=1830 /DNA_ORIENTATION=+